MEYCENKTEKESKGAEEKGKGSSKYYIAYMIS